LKVKMSLFWLSCTQAAIQFVGVNEHNKSLKADALKGAA
jgi:hypothetical protein